MTKIIIDPGHGGRDPGATSSGAQEKNFNLTIALKIVSFLNAYYEATVLMTRTTDKTLSLSQRSSYANSQNADYFCSIHVNAGGGTGWESYIYNGSVSTFTINAQNTIHSTVINAIGPKYSITNRGKKRANFHVLRETNMPAILLENLFIDTTKDRTLLQNSTFINNISSAIGLGIARALSLPSKNPAYYRVIAGSFTIKENADDRKSFLESKGISAFDVTKIINGTTYYRVQAGAFSERENADQRLAEVKALGITDAYILYE